MDRTLYLVLIYVHPGKHDVLRAYERQALPSILRHGGAFERVMRPVEAATERDTPDEVHLLSFNSAEGFALFRADPDMERLHALREEAVRKVIMIRAADVPLDEYFGGAAPSA